MESEKKCSQAFVTGRYLISVADETMRCNVTKWCNPVIAMGNRNCCGIDE